MQQYITICNHGPLIADTTFWASEMARGGYIYLSINAGCFRLLVPTAFIRKNGWIHDAIAGAEAVLLTRGAWEERGKTDGMEILFEDNSNEPYCIHLSPEQCESMPLESDRDRPSEPPKWTMLIYLEGVEEPVSMPVRYRKKKRIPYLKPWAE